GVVAHAARSGNSVAVAPEGTRSKTGQLQPFKKGAFHLQEQLAWPVLPVVVQGAFELCPPCAAFPLSGQVVLRYLPAIQSGPSRADMAVVVRNRLQASLEDIPVTAGAPLTWCGRLANVGAVLATYVLTWRWGAAASSVGLRALGLTPAAAAMAFAAYVVAMTMIIRVGYCK
ncbi:unnamed protein product, partial [Phaeothamnion confervicola]